MAWARTRRIMLGILIVAVLLANPFRRPSTQQVYYRTLSDRHGKLAAECRAREQQARARGQVPVADQLRVEALRHDRMYWLYRQGSYESDESRTRWPGRP